MNAETQEFLEPTLEYAMDDVEMEDVSDKDEQENEEEEEEI